MRWVPAALILPLVLLLSLGVWAVLGERERAQAATLTEARNWAETTSELLDSLEPPTIVLRDRVVSHSELFYADDQDA